MADANGRDRPGVVAHPPLIYGGFLALGFGLDWAWPAPLFAARLAGGWRIALGALLAACGGLLLAAGIRQFRKRGTSFRTDKPSTAVITNGLYRYSRNPLYIALSLVYAGLGVALDSVWVLALLVPVLLVIRFGVVAREERYLERTFGEEYLRYKRAVRRWL
jgi:protein-S-isoprenylcysteine O-methyltransferase Ste14